MKHEGYYYFYCRRCGWGVCAFGDSIFVQRYKKSRKYPRCPYCKVRGSGAHDMIHRDFDYNEIPDEAYMSNIREPVQLRISIPKKLRQAVFEKYGRICFYCGSTENSQIDHIIPVTEKGENTLDNLRVVCRSCNISKLNYNDISDKRKVIIHIRQACTDLIGKEKVSMAEVARVSGESYHFILKHEDKVRKELKLPPNRKKYLYPAPKEG